MVKAAWKLANIPHDDVRASRIYSPQRLYSAAVAFAAVFVACLFGIFTRPLGFLATFWPANALMLGLLIRLPASASPIGWTAGAAAFLAADLLTGSPLIKALLLNGANVIGIAAAYLVYVHSPTGRTGLRQAGSMLYLLLSAAAGGAAAGAVGGIANPILFNGSVMNGWTFWFATEFVNYVTILPVILSAPALSDLSERFRAPVFLRKTDFAPACALMISFVAAVLIGGPGALAFPVPALLWCGLVYPVFPTAVLTLVFGIWTLLILSTGYVANPIHEEMALASLRLGISLIAVAPIMLACVTRDRKELVAQLQHLAAHDPLTGLFNRKAFRDDAQRRLGEISQSCALLVFDLDHFKTVNDTYGHAAGDRVLIAFAERARGCLHPEDLLARLGGEEFVAFVSKGSEADTLALADRIRLACREPIYLEEGISLKVTTSIGIAIVETPHETCLDTMLQCADRLLYRAKHAGRDRIEWSKIHLTPSETSTLASGDPQSGDRVSHVIWK